MSEKFKENLSKEKTDKTINVLDAENLEEKQQKRTDEVEKIDLEKESRDFLERMRIERKNDKKIDYNSACMIIENILDNRKLKPFLQVSEEEAEILKRVIECIKYQKIGLGDMSALSEIDRRIYGGISKRITSLPASDPHFVVQDINDTNIHYLCVESGKALTIRERNGYFFVVHKIPTEKLEKDRQKIKERIDSLKDSAYFPLTVLAENAVEIEYIPSTETPERGEDILDFYNFCQKINFGADTNATNFLRHNGQLKYTDQDLMHWIIDPKSTSFDERIKTGTTRSKTW